MAMDDGDGASACWCCGQAFAEATLARLTARPEVAICDGCAGGLASRRRIVLRAVPVLATDDVAASAAFWRAAGFTVSLYGADFASAHRDGVELHLVEPVPDERERGMAYLHVRGVDRVHDEWEAAGVPVSDVRDEPWEMREFTIVDPGGNHVRIGENL